MQNLTSLKVRTAEAQKYFDNLVVSIAAKEPVLQHLVDSIKEAEKTLENEFSQQRLNLQRDHLKQKEDLDAEIVHIKNTITVLRDKERAQLEVNNKIEHQGNELKTALNIQQQRRRELSYELESLSSEVMRLRSDETKFKNSLDNLRSEKKIAEDDLASQILNHGTTVFEMQKDFYEKQNKLDGQIEQSKIELREIQQLLLLHNNKMIEVNEEYKKRDNDLINRENSLIIKIKALAKDREEFEIETRRWNYIKPKE